MNRFLESNGSNQKIWIKLSIISVFTAMFKKRRMVAKNKHHILKEPGLIPWGMGFLDDSSISSRKMTAMKMRPNLGHFGTKRIKGSIKYF